VDEEKLLRSRHSIRSYESNVLLNKINFLCLATESYEYSVPADYDFKGAKGCTTHELRSEIRLYQCFQADVSVFTRISARGQSGAEAVILGCTEISLLIKPKDSAVPLFDTTEIHARSAARWAM
jgi:aspartate racemase